MPGHIKLVKGAVDPDPTEFLLPSMDMKRADQQKPYDSKKSVWIPDEKTHGYKEGLLESGDLEDPASKCVVAVGHEKFTVKGALVGKVNPPKFEKVEDMVNLTFLNDASVFWNLKTRYQAKLIHTYSGLFVVVVNPYKRYPLYTHRVCKIYLGKRRNECPPHLWAIAEGAYRDMMQNKKDNAMLITGESGAGKTENTKKVITYLAMVAAGPGSKKAEKKVSLEDQIVATNPILESYGNAKTARNDNSSRFGKFIRIHFTASGKLAGCDIVSYLLEKSRITEQQEVERSYHIFYQLLQPYGDGICPETLRAKCCVSNDIYDYIYVPQGKTTVASIDDNEELEYTEDAFNVLGFNDQEKFDCYMLTAGVMTAGGIAYIQKGRDDQAELEKTTPDTFPGKFAQLCGVEAAPLFKAFCKPRIKVGTEWVTKGQNIIQSTNAVGGIARGIYDRVFKWLIEKCNQTLIDPTMKKCNFVAVLDIAGFEMFEYNGFEQISINFVNEKLQQFFNHHMFVVEQEEYVSEGIDWVMVDFGMDLQAAIIMFEKPMGLWAILEEESLFPKATDKSFEEKLKAALGKLPIFLKPQSKTDKNAHFAIQHYAGVVSYNVTGWLEKNKDPVNDTVVEIFKSTSSNSLLVHLWRDHAGCQTQAPKQEEKGKKKKGGGGKTVSSVYLVQLTALMNTLHSTEPHFIRCIVPNTHKQPGGVEPPLIMHQLTCNGVLEGIRICMRGFPNRILYPDFKQRYTILSKGKCDMKTEDKKAAGIILDSTPNFPPEKYRLGNTKVFFRAGALAALEEERDDIVTALIRYVQGQIYARQGKARYQKKSNQRNMIMVIQRQFRKYIKNRNWGWFVIIQKTRPLIGLRNPEEEFRLLEEKAKEAYGAYEEQLNTKKMLEEENVIAAEEIAQLKAKLNAEQGDLSSYMEKQAKLSAQKADLEVQLRENEEKLAEEERMKALAEEDRRGGDREIASIKRDYQDLVAKNEKLQAEKAKRDQILRGLNDEVLHQDEQISKLNKEKKYISETVGKASDDLTAAEDKVHHLNEVKIKLEQTLDQMDGSLEKEKRTKYNIEKERRKLEGDLKMCQEMVLDFERGKRELEQSIMRKDTELNGLMGKLDDEQGGVGRTQRSIKELQARVEEMEEELEAERQSRAKAERQRAELSREYDELTDRLDESCVATAAQIELNKKRETEILKMRKDLEECNIQHESTLLSLRKKHQDAITEMSEQCDQLNKMKVKIEKDKLAVRMQLDDTKAATDHVSHERAVADKNLKALQGQLQSLMKRIEEATVVLAEYDAGNKRLMSENSNLYTRLEELLNNVSMLQKVKISLSSQLDDAKRMCEDEAKERQSLLGRFRTIEHEYDGVKEHFDDEMQQKEEAARTLQKLMADANIWRHKYETEAMGKIEELEMTKLKLQARLAESEGTMENLNSKLMSLEKAKLAISKEIEDVVHRVDQVNIMYNQAEKRVKLMDKVIAEWKTKADCISLELNNSQKECRNASAELFRVKNGYDEASGQLDDVRRENRALSDEIKDLMEQISDGGRTIHEIEKQRKRTEIEKADLESALSEAETALEFEETKLLKLTLELNQLKSDIDKRIQEKEEEFEGTRRNHSKAMEHLQFAIEEESKSKAEAIRSKKKLEQDINELDSSLQRSTLENADIQKNVKKYQESMRAKIDDLENAKRETDSYREYMINSERKANSLKNSVEETRAMLDQSDKSRRQIEQELSDCHEESAKLTVQNASLESTKRKVEGDIHELQLELEEVSEELKEREIKARDCMIDASKMAEELHLEQEQSAIYERERKALETKVRDLQVKLEDAENNSIKHGKKMIGRLEEKARELVAEVDNEERRRSEALKNLKKTERGVNEYLYRSNEDNRNSERIKDLIDRMQQQVRMFKKQLEEAEDIAANNLAKFKVVQKALVDAQERAGETETELDRKKGMSRGTSLAREF
jgi:myosin heavy chain 6/7